MQRELAALLRKGVKDPRVGAVTITRVELSDDLRSGRVLFVPMGQVGDAARVDECTAGLKAASAYLAGQVARSLRLRSVPALRFDYDRGIDNLISIHETLRGLDKKEGTP